MIIKLAEEMTFPFLEVSTNQRERKYVRESLQES